MRVLILISAALVMMVSQVIAQEYKLPMKEIQVKASEATETLGKLVAQQKNYKEMGFESPDELRRMKLGEPLQVFIVQLDQLKEYQTGSDPSKMLSGGNHVIYPVMVDDQVRSSVTLAEVDENWKATSFGNPTFVKLLTKIRKDNAESTGLPPSLFFVVQVLALNFHFLGYRVDDELMLSPVMDNPRFAFKTGAGMSAQSIFTAILPAAKAHDGLPR